LNVTIIGAPMDLGAGRRGVDMGPSAIRLAGLHERLRKIGHHVEDAGDVFSPVAETLEVVDPSLRFLDEIVDSCKALADEVETAAKSGRFPLVLGGDHSVAIGTIAGLTRVAQRVGVIWVDAHGDFNTPETSPTGNIHGMPLSATCGIGAEALTNLGERTPMLEIEDVALVGIRDIDPVEARMIVDQGPEAFTVRDIDEMGMKEVVDRALDIATRDADWLHVSFDLDAIDPRWAPGTGTPVQGGLTLREAHLLLEILADSEMVRSMELVETNPILDIRNQTGELAAWLAASCLGAKIMYGHRDEL
jgi:arginase